VQVVGVEFYDSQSGSDSRQTAEGRYTVRVLEFGDLVCEPQASLTRGLLVRL